MVRRKKHDLDMHRAKRLLYRRDTALLRPLVLDLFKGVPFRNLCSGNPSGAGDNGHFSLKRQTREISLSRNHEVATIPAASFGGRGRFSKLDDIEVGIGESYT